MRTAGVSNVCAICGEAIEKTDRDAAYIKIIKLATGKACKSIVCGSCFWNEEICEAWDEERCGK